MLCAQRPDTIIQICVECTMYRCCNEFACVLCVGSGKPACFEAAWGTNKKKRMNNGYQIPSIIQSCAVRVLLRVRLATFVRLGLLWFVQMRCYTLLYTFPWHYVVRMHAYAYHQMHTCLLRLGTPLQSIILPSVVCITSWIINIIAFQHPAAYMCNTWAMYDYTSFKTKLLATSKPLKKYIL